MVAIRASRRRSRAGVARASSSVNEPWPSSRYEHRDERHRAHDHPHDLRRTGSRERAGWAQYEVDGQRRCPRAAATPPGTRPWCAHGVRPVPGQPLAKRWVPMTRGPRPARDHRSGRRAPRRVPGRAGAAGPTDTGTAAARHSAPNVDDRRPTSRRWPTTWRSCRGRTMRPDGQRPNGEREHDEDREGPCRRRRGCDAGLRHGVESVTPSPLRQIVRRCHPGHIERAVGRSGGRFLYVGPCRSSTTRRRVAPASPRVPPQEVGSPVRGWVPWRSLDAGPHVPARRRRPRSRRSGVGRPDGSAGLWRRPWVSLYGRRRSSIALDGGNPGPVLPSGGSGPVERSRRQPDSGELFDVLG